MGREEIRHSTIKLAQEKCNFGMVDGNKSLRKEHSPAVSNYVISISEIPVVIAEQSKKIRVF